MRLLEASGLEATSFASAEEFLASEERRRTACLVLDIRLPGLSGFELCERLSGEGLAARAIYVTAHDDPISRERAAREGAPYFVKPVTADALLASIAQVLVAR